MSRRPIVDDNNFVRICGESKSIREVARKCNCQPNQVRARLKTLKPKYGDITPTGYYPEQRHSRKTEVFNRKKKYTIVAFSDAHFWPEHLAPMSAANKVLLKILDDIKPDIIHDNGDSFDGASISRFPKHRIQTELPSVSEEVEINEIRHEEMVAASPKSKCFWIFGNHDDRFQNHLLNNAEGFSELPFGTLESYFPDWEFADALFYNETLYATHQFKGGIGAARANTLNAGKSIMTGHLHTGADIPVNDLNGLRWGISIPTLADPRESMFNYATLTDWHSGLKVITVHGDIVTPESVIIGNDGKAHFRGKTY